MINKPYAESCDQNREPIRRQLDRFAPDCNSVLEIASGTGQHAVYFARCYPHLRWQTSDLPQHHAGIQAWIDDSDCSNVSSPLALDVCGAWPQQRYDLIFSANSVHIMSSQAAEQFLRQAPNCLNAGAMLMLYGPFNYAGRYTSPSNAHFDDWLKQRDPASGIKDFEWLNAIARESGLDIVDDVAMPANNRILIFRKLNARALD